MRELADKLLRLDRRVIFVLIALATLIPLLRPIGLPVRISPEVRQVHDYIESLPAGSVFLLSLDFDPASKPELYPMAVALLNHAFKRDLRVIAMTLLVTGTGMAEKVVSGIASEHGKRRGLDYAFLGYSPGGSNVIINMGQDLAVAFPTDHYGERTADLPVLQGINSLRQVNYVISLAAGTPGVESWYVYGKEKYGFELGGGVTAVIAPGLYPFLDTGQINGLIGGLRGAAEYETLIGMKGKAVAGMDAQSATHFIIIGLILICNLFYFLTRRTKTRSFGSAQNRPDSPPETRR
ncbi:MAG: hypothetical protein K8G79_00840 [bacterium]|uniref:Uncharacterized protein n=1 Tax=Candidatus Methylomirabilis tolerans TaxID=3123416 RepID=A0AAJ1AHP8_9BACT|nr:hypothetical protein [Candidatus Methylomirabilis sp.]